MYLADKIHHLKYTNYHSNIIKYINKKIKKNEHENTRWSMAKSQSNCI